VSPQRTTQLPSVFRSAAAGRAAVREVLREGGIRPSDAAELVVSELVTNAVRHGRAPIRMVLELAGSLLRVTVIDSAPRELDLRLRTPGPESMNGRGLLLVDAVARRWGINADDREKAVWAEVEVSPLNRVD
jgi:anti-sigma regulatory factor (Ser/Thr protein kinase)